MRFIDKRNVENRVKGLRINQLLLREHWIDGKYVNLSYNEVDKSELVKHIVAEQEYLCCYCMRTLHIEEEGTYKANVTLEHVIPHKIKKDDWLRDRRLYRKFPILRDNHISICFEGKLSDPSKPFGMPPFPHFIAYDNLVASCDGLTLDESSEILPHHCCNNKRGNSFVEPLFFHSNVLSLITYDKRGHLQCPGEYVEYLGENGVNIMSRFLNDVRLFWSKIAESDYSVSQIKDADEDEELRLDIIDDIFTIDPTGHWLFLEKKEAWCVFSDYSSFRKRHCHQI